MPLATNSTPGSIELAGDLTGNANAPELRNTGVVPGTYNFADVIVDDKGRVVYTTARIAAGGVATTSQQGYVQIGANIDVTGGGVISLSGNVPLLNGENIFSRAQRSSIQFSSAASLTPDLSSYDIFDQTSGALTINAPVNGLDGQSFIIILESLAVTTATVLPVAGSPVTTRSIAWNGTVFCAIRNAATNVAYTSTDGVTWTTRFLPSVQDWRCVVWNGTVFCAIATTTTVAATSPDGITWTTRTMPSSHQWVALAWNGTVFCAIAFASTVAATSPDGITWTSRTTSLSESWRAITAKSGVFCVVGGEADQCMTSPDGITWTTRTMSVSLAWNGIASNGTLFCAVGNGGGVGTTVAATSPDGITWTTRTMPSSQFWHRADAIGSLFCVAATNATVFALSVDGITWKQFALPSTGTTWQSISNNGTFFVLSGGNVEPNEVLVQLSLPVFSAEYLFSNSTTVNLDVKVLQCDVVGSTVLTTFI